MPWSLSLVGPISDGDSPPSCLAAINAGRLCRRPPSFHEAGRVAFFSEPSLHFSTTLPQPPVCSATAESTLLVFVLVLAVPQGSCDPRYFIDFTGSSSLQLSTLFMFSPTAIRSLPRPPTTRAPPRTCLVIWITFQHAWRFVACPGHRGLFITAYCPAPPLPWRESARTMPVLLFPPQHPFIFSCRSGFWPRAPHRPRWSLPVCSESVLCSVTVLVPHGVRPNSFYLAPAVSGRSHFLQGIFSRLARFSFVLCAFCPEILALTVVAPRGRLLLNAAVVVRSFVCPLLEEVTFPR